jgi:hypothetical protein
LVAATRRNALRSRKDMMIVRISNMHTPGIINYTGNAYDTNFR